MMTLAPILFAGLLGLIIGSFLNVVISRVPAGESIMGRSHCPKCLTLIKPYDNIPVAGWLLLRGKCRACRNSISPQYILVELVTAVMFAAIVSVFDVTYLSVTLIVVAAITIALSVIDYQTLRLPDGLTLPAIPVTAVGLTLAAWNTGGWEALTRAGIAAAALTAAYGLLWAVTHGRGIGFGDVKLAPTIAAITAYLGWGPFAVGVGAGWVMGALVAVIGLVTGQVRMGRAIPFGPSLIAGTWIAVFVGPHVWNWYSQFLSH